MIVELHSLTEAQISDLKELMKQLAPDIAYLKVHSPIDLHLTSNPQRVSANALYKAAGFELRDTNAYHMRLMFNE